MKHAPILFCLLVSSAPAIFAADLPPHASFLRELVSISSGTASINGVNEVQEKVAVRLKALGFNVEMKPNPQSGIISGKQLSATLKGQDPRYITLVGHADTVFEKLNPFEVSADGKIAFGTGFHLEGLHQRSGRRADVGRVAPHLGLVLGGLQRRRR